MDLTLLAAERERFAKVVAARKTHHDLFELLDKLKTSEKFSQLAKPYLALDLIEACVRRVADRQCMALLRALESNDTLALIASGVPVSQSRPTLGRLVRKTMQSCPMDESFLMEAFIQLERSGVCVERGDALELALQAGMDPDTLGTICNLTFEAYYLCS